MTLNEFLKSVSNALEIEKVRYALAGGLITSIYRLEERTTKDIDFLIFAQSNTQDVAAKIIKNFGLIPSIIRKADLEGGPMFAIKKKNTHPFIIAGRNINDPEKIGLDFILPQMPWFESALPRAEENKIDFGFGKIPCLTVEDIILSKFYSLKNDSLRFNDLDDLKSIFNAHHDLDLSYLTGQMQKFRFIVPDQIDRIVPNQLRLTSKMIRNS